MSLPSDARVVIKSVSIVARADEGQKVDEIQLSQARDLLSKCTGLEIIFAIRQHRSILGAYFR